METLLILTYASICWIVFKVFKLPVNKWSMTTVVLGGVILLGSILMVMAYYHPASMTARSYFVSTPIVPNVRGKIVSVDAVPNKLVEKGDILFKLNTTPFQAAFDDLNSQLKFNQRRLEDSIKLNKVAGGSKFDIQKYENRVNSLKAKLVKAKFDLDSCVVKAPSKGYVTQVRARVGQMAVTIPMLPVMTFIPAETKYLIAGFTQEPIQNIKVGNEVEIIFSGIPGSLFHGKVTQILPALAEGEIAPGQTMVSLQRSFIRGQVPVMIEITDDMSQYHLPMGIDASVAIYSHGSIVHHVAIIRKVLLRMNSWKNFLRFH